MGSSSAPLRTVGRYALYGELAAGGMATVHFGRLLGPVGFARTVAIKRLHPQFAKDPEFVSMFLDEARLAARIQHPNVVATLDVVASRGELFLVLEYVAGESLARLGRAARESGRGTPPSVATAIVSGALHGLHAAHEAKNEHGAPLGLVHRDVSPQNILVGRDGTARVLDFGVAKAAGRFHTTRDSNIKGKLPYMSPEQLRGHDVDRTTDIYAAAVVLWEALTGRRLFKRDDQPAILQAVLYDPVVPPSTHAPDIPPAVDALVMRGLDRDAARRFRTAREFALALERAMTPALASDVGDWVDSVAGEVLAHRAEQIAELESSSSEATSVDDMMASIRHDGAPSRDLPVQPPPPPYVEGSQVSGVTTANTQSPPPAPRRRPVVLAIGLLAAVLAIGLAFLLGGAHTRRENVAVAAAPVPPPPAASPSLAFETPPPPPTFREAEPASAPTLPVPVAAAPPRPPRPIPKPVAADCATPWKIGPDGEKVYKRECIK